MSRPRTHPNTTSYQWCRWSTTRDTITPSASSGSHRIDLREREICVTWSWIQTHAKKQLHVIMLLWPEGVDFMPSMSRARSGWEHVSLTRTGVRVVAVWMGMQRAMKSGRKFPIENLSTLVSMAVTPMQTHMSTMAQWKRCGEGCIHAARSKFLLTLERFQSVALLEQYARQTHMGTSTVNAKQSSEVTSSRSTYDFEIDSVSIMKDLSMLGTHVTSVYTKWANVTNASR